MHPFLNGKMIIGGLSLMLCAKAALSFTGLPPLRDAEPVVQDQVVQAAAKGKEKAAPQPAKDAPPMVTDLPEVTEATSEVPEDVLRSLTRERELVALQKQEIEAQRAEIALAMERLNVERASLSELKVSIEELLARIDASKTDDLNRLIAFYQNMKPADAARIIDDLDIETTIMILGEMKPRAAAPILAKVSPVRARAVSKIILERSQLPGDQDLVGIRLK